MHKGRNLVVDTFSDVYRLLKPWRDHEFWDFQTHEPIPNSIYVIGRKQFTENTEKIRGMIESPDFCVVFDNAAEGSWTLVSQLQMLRLDDLARTRKFLIIAGADIDEHYAFVTYEHFMTSILDYSENQHAMKNIGNIFEKKQKPFKFLFLNGRARPHRKFLYETLRCHGLLDSAIWTMLDGRPSPSKDFHLCIDDVDLMAKVSELQILPVCYEYKKYRNAHVHTGPAQRSFVKNQLFGGEWGEIYLESRPYIDSYFSLVTETVYNYRYSFRTEKIAKVLAQGHPWICAANPGFYRDIRNMGFRTFEKLINEKFDDIETHQTRMQRIADIVKDLCQQDLSSFLCACQDICKYNQQHLVELQPILRSHFPNQFFNLIDQHE